MSARSPRDDPISAATPALAVARRRSIAKPCSTRRSAARRRGRRGADDAPARERARRVRDGALPARGQQGRAADGAGRPPRGPARLPAAPARPEGRDARAVVDDLRQPRGASLGPRGAGAPPDDGAVGARRDRGDPCGAAGRGPVDRRRGAGLPPDVELHARLAARARRRELGGAEPAAASFAAPPIPSATRCWRRPPRRGRPPPTATPTARTSARSSTRCSPADAARSTFRLPVRVNRSMRRHDFDRFVADSTDGLLRTAYLIVWDLPEAEDLRPGDAVQGRQALAQGQPHGSPGRLRSPHPGQPRARRGRQALAPAGRAERAQPGEPGARGCRPRSTPTTSSTRRSRRSRRASARCSSCATSSIFPKPRWRPHFSAPSAPSRARLLVDSRDSSRRCARLTTQGASHHDQLETDLRAALHERAARVHAPPGSSPPTTTRARAACGRRWRSAAGSRPPWARSVAVLSLAGGASSAFAGWTPQPTAPTPAQLAAAQAYCARQCADARAAAEADRHARAVHVPGLLRRQLDDFCTTRSVVQQRVGVEHLAAVTVPAGRLYLWAEHTTTQAGESYGS